MSGRVSPHGKSTIPHADVSQGGGRGGGSSRGGGPPAAQAGGEKKKRESILNLQQYVDKSIRVKFMGGREGKRGPFTHFAAGIG